MIDLKQLEKLIGKEVKHFYIFFSDPLLLDAALIFVDTIQSEIFQMDLSDNSLSAIKASDLRNPVAIDIDPLEELIFWTDVVAKTIKRSTLSGNGEVTIQQLTSGKDYR